MDDEKIVILKEDGTEDTAAMRRQKIRNTVQNIWDGAKKTAKNAWQFFKDNKEDVIAFGTMATAAIVGIKKITARPQQETERYRIDTTYYDPSTGCHWRLKRQLTNAERAELMYRRRNGEFTEDILEDMRVLR